MPCNPIDVRPQDVNLPMVVDVPKEESLILSRVFAVAIAVLCFCNGALHLALSGVKIVVLPIAYLTSTQEECGRLFDEAVSHFLSSVPDAGRGGLYVFVALVSPRTVFSHWEERRAIGKSDAGSDTEVGMLELGPERLNVVAVDLKPEATPATTVEAGKEPPSVVSESETRTPESAKIEVRSSDSDTREKVPEPVLVVETVVEVQVIEEPKPKPPVAVQETLQQAEPAPQVEQQVVVQQVASVTVTGTTTTVSAAAPEARPEARVERSEEKKAEVDPYRATEKEQAIMTDIITKLATYGPNDFRKNGEALIALGESIKKVHTLYYLEWILTDPVLKAHFFKLGDQFLRKIVWRTFVSETAEALKEWHKNDKQCKYMQRFCEKTGANIDELRSHFTKGEWSDFIYKLHDLAKPKKNRNK